MSSDGRQQASQCAMFMPLQVQRKLKATEGTDAYSDATPLRLLPCDKACQSTKASCLIPEHALCSLDSSMCMDFLALLFVSALLLSLTVVVVGSPTSNLSSMVFVKSSCVVLTEQAGG